MNGVNQIAILGVGYVGLPLAICFSKTTKVIGFDLDPRRLDELRSGHDRTREASEAELRESGIRFTSEAAELKGTSFFIVTVPTPVDEFNTPDLRPLLGACKTLAAVMSAGSTIVFESTVYPGLTEEVLAPELERLSGLRFNRDFFLGYSPERVNPGDKEHSIPKIRKIVAGSTPQTLDLVHSVYSRIVGAGLHRAPNIATAEAAKVIENIQRDVNIGLINELTVLFERLGLDIHEVLEASATKWNFLKFKPGLVGGHCIGVDPFYLTHKARQVGHHPAMILAGRRVNDSMAEFYAGKLLRHLLKRGVSPLGAEALVLGFTFKENCPDVRNTKVNDLVVSLKNYGLRVDVVDPIADAELARRDYGIDLAGEVAPGKKYSATLLAVPHRDVLAMVEGNAERFLARHSTQEGFILDIKGVLPASPRVVH